MATPLALLLVVKPRLGAVAADRHVAPGPAAVLAAVDKQPFAIRADLQPFLIGRSDQLQRRTCGGEIDRAGLGIAGMGCEYQGKPTKQARDQPVVVHAMKRAMPEMRVDGFPERQEVRLAFLRDGCKRGKIRPLRRQFTRSLGKGAEAVPAPRNDRSGASRRSAGSRCWRHRARERRR